MAPDPHGTTAEVESPEGGAGAPTDPVALETDPASSPVAGRVRGSGRPLEPPTPAPPQGRSVRRGRRVKRVIRRIELWSVLKLSLVFYTCMYVVVMAALVVLWGFAYSTGLVDNFESFANDVGFEHWQFYGQHMFHQAAVIGGVLVVAATIVTVLATALVNVISELTGGIRIVMIEEEVMFLLVDPDDHGRALMAADAAARRRARLRASAAPVADHEPVRPVLGIRAGRAPHRLGYRRCVPGL